MSGVAAPLASSPSTSTSGPPIMVGDVLDLVRDRSAVDLAQAREDVREGFALDVNAEKRGGDARLELGRQRRLVLALVERGIPERLGAERVEMRRQMPVRANGVDERHRRCNATEKLCVDSGRGRRSGRLGRSARRIDRRCGLG